MFSQAVAAGPSSGSALGRFFTLLSLRVFTHTVACSLPGFSLLWFQLPTATGSAQHSEVFWGRKRRCSHSAYYSTRSRCSILVFVLLFVSCHASFTN